MSETKWYHIKLREKGGRAYWFLSGRGGLNRLRIHAAIFTELERAKEVLAKILADNDNLEGKVQ